MFSAHLWAFRVLCLKVSKIVYLLDRLKLQWSHLGLSGLFLLSNLFKITHKVNTIVYLHTCSRCRLLIHICCYWAVPARHRPDCRTVSRTVHSACESSLCRCCCGCRNSRSYSDQNLSHSRMALRVSTTTLGQFQSGVKTILFRLAYGTWLGAFVTV